MKIPIFKRNLVYSLLDDIEKNLDAYKNGDFTAILSRAEYSADIRELKNVSYDPDKLKDLRADLSTERDVDNAILVHDVFSELTPALATDGRIWTAICHRDCLQFSWDRWVARVKTPEQQIKAIKTHLFVGAQDRALIRNNALSSLWWIAHVATKNRPDVSAEEAITDFANLSDLRSAIIERPTISRVPNVFGAIMRCYKTKITQDPTTEFFRRTRRGGKYREWLKRINNLGGMLYFPAMGENELYEEFWQLLETVEKEKTA